MRGDDILFKSRRSINWDDIEQILMHYIGEYYEIAETAEKVYIGSDFPDEFTHSKYTKAIRGANEKAKANVITAIGELIQISDKKAEFPDYGNRHGNKAKNKIDIVTDPDGNKIVLINDILFRSRRSINWDDIEQVLMHYIGGIL